MRNSIRISLVVSMIAFVTIVLMGCTKSYRVSKKDSYIPYDGCVDIYNASREELIRIDMCNYTAVFGEVKDENKACQIAKEVIKKVYQKDESPYIVKLNTTANAWIVSGTLPPFHFGGVASIAIDKETGEILMLIHTK